MGPQGRGTGRAGLEGQVRIRGGRLERTFPIVKSWAQVGHGLREHSLGRGFSMLGRVLEENSTRGQRSK